MVCQVGLSGLLVIEGIWCEMCGIVVGVVGVFG